jgi:multidrug efflux pump subunit AcrB
MQDQVAERIEKKLQELPYFDRAQTYTKPGFSAIQMTFGTARRRATCPSSSTRCARS